MQNYSNEMLTINIAKAELKKAFFGGTADFTQSVNRRIHRPKQILFRNRKTP
jgi:hypothetical protein